MFDTSSIQFRINCNFSPASPSYPYQKRASPSYSFFDPFLLQSASFPLKLPAMGYVDIVLDRNVMFWVLIPLTLASFLMGVIRHYATVLFFSPKMEDKFDAKGQKMFREVQIVRRAESTRVFGGWIPPRAYAARK